MKRLVVGGFGAQACSVIATLICARMIGPVAFAVAATIMAIGTTAGSLSSFGVNSHHIRVIARGASSADSLLEEFVFRVVIAASIGLLIAAILLVIGALSLIGVGVVLIVAVSSQAGQCCQVPLLGHGRYTAISTVVTVDKVIFASGVGGLACFGALSPVTYSLSYAAGDAIAAFVFSRLWLRPRRLNFGGAVSRIWRMYRSSSWIGCAQVSFSAQQLDVPIAQIASPGVATGEYAAVSRWTQPIVILASAAATTTLRDASRSGSDSAALALVRRSMLRPVLLACGASSLGAVLALFYSSKILGSGYDGAGLAAFVLLLGAPFSFVCQVMVNLLVARGRDRAAGAGALVSVGLQLCAVFPFTKELGGLGPALACTLMEIGYSIYLQRQCGKLK